MIIRVACSIPIRRPLRVDPAFEAVACIRVDLERAARVGGAHRIEIGRFDEDVDRLLRHAGGQTAHHAADALHPVRVRNQRHAFGEGVLLVVQPHQRLAAPRAVDAQGIARDLVRVEDMQRPVPVEGEEVGDIHQKADRPQADGAQTVLQPLGAGAVCDAADDAPEEDGALRERIRVDAHAYRAGEGARDRIHVARLELAQTPCRQIARDAAHTQRVGAVGRDRDLDHRIDLGRIILGQPVDKAVADIARGQLDNAVMLLADSSSSRSEAIMPKLSIPRILPTPMVVSMPGT